MEEERKVIVAKKKERFFFTEMKLIQSNKRQTKYSAKTWRDVNGIKKEKEIRPATIRHICLIIAETSVHKNT